MGLVLECLLTAFPFPFGILVLLFLALNIINIVINIISYIKGAIPFL